MSQMIGNVSKGLPSSNADGTKPIVRLDRYGNQIVIPHSAGLSGICDEGQYFAGMATPPGTAYALTGAAQTAWVATTPTLLIMNRDAAGGKRLVLDFMRIVFATAGTAGTRVEGAVIIDSIDRYSSGGTVLVPANANMDSATTSITQLTAARLFGGAITANAASTPRNLYRFTLSTTIPAIGESHIINFGALESATHVNKAASLGPCIVGPGQTALVYLWLPTQSAAPTGEISIGWWER